VCLPQELAIAGIHDMTAANRYLDEVYRPAFNAEFMPPALEEGSAFVPWIGGRLDDFLCETFGRVVGKDNCVAFEGMALRSPRTATGCITGRSRCGGIASPMATSPCSTDHVARLAMMPKVSRFRYSYRLSRGSAAISKAGSLCATKPDSSICYQQVVDVIAIGGIIGP